MAQDRKPTVNPVIPETRDVFFISSIIDSMRFSCSSMGRYLKQAVRARSMRSGRLGLFMVIDYRVLAFALGNLPLDIPLGLCGGR